LEKKNDKMKKQSNDELESLAAKVLEEIPTGIELIRLGPRPLFIEFCGTPKAGKTTCADRLTYFLNRSGYQVLKIVERASLCPLRNKHHVSFNIWTACTALVQILEAKEKDYNIVILDRGIFDALCWMNFMTMTGRLTEAEKEKIVSFFLLDYWLSMLDIVFLMVTTPQEAVRREFQDQLIQKEGSIMNERTLTLYNKAIEKTYEDMAKHFKSVIKINTTKFTQIECAKAVTKESLQVLHNLLNEEVMVIERKLLDQFNFSQGLIDDEKAVHAIASTIQDRHHFISRRTAEIKSELIQIIPCAIVEYDSKVMLLRRKERDSRDRLHNKYAIWAGGHVRKQDKVDGREIIESALERELDEELFIKSSMDKSLIAFVYDQTNPRSRLHMGAVYRVRVNSPDVYLAMDQQEFKEKKGLSVSGKFFSPEEIVSKYNSGLEPWSRCILQHLYKISPLKEDEKGQLEIDVYK